MGRSLSCQQSLGKSREAAFVQTGLNVAIPDSLEINHGRGDVAVTHPLLQCTGLLAKRFGGFENRPVGSVGPEGTVIANVFDVAVERIFQRCMLLDWFNDGQGAMIPLRVAASSAGLIPCLVGCILSVGTGRLKVALALVPPLNKVASFGVAFINAVDTDTIATHPALTVEKSASVPPLAVDFDLLEKCYGRKFRHWRFLEEPPIESLISCPLLVCNGSVGNPLFCCVQSLC